ncbi:SEL1-like repeat protein [Trinickia soli]|uniref:SEL1-like repeat protein n=1 Tax=Trinickia soli TaxID=380675 RepID=UPI001E5B225A|nr:sel1 repeat family protein [Trinickia soli]
MRQNLAFSCTHESSHLPALNADADKLFMYARYLQKQSDPADFDDIMRYYRIAAAYGHYKANINAQLLIGQGLVVSPEGQKEAVDLAMQAVREGIPGGYYDIGHYLEIGYGVKQDAMAALRYFRKAADLGNPEAQDYVAEKLLPDEKSREIAVQMWQCAVAQGYAKAADSLGNVLGAEGRFPEAVTAYQRGVAAGSSLSAFGLENGFKGPPPSDRLYYIGLPNDPERSDRYRKIREFFERNDGRNPNVPDIERIVPLPPAKLPAWDGTFQWEKEQAAAKPPEKPSDDLVNRMAKDKNLDPATGLPLSDAPAKTSETEQQPAGVASHVDRLPIGTVALTGDKCPEDGVWCANLGNRQAANTQRRFVKGDTLPPVVIQAPRQIAILDRWMGAREQPENVVWQLVSYSDNV